MAMASVVMLVYQRVQCDFLEKIGHHFFGWQGAGMLTGGLGTVLSGSPWVPISVAMCCQDSHPVGEIIPQNGAFFQLGGFLYEMPQTSYRGIHGPWDCEHCERPKSIKISKCDSKLSGTDF